MRPPGWVNNVLPALSGLLREASRRALGAHDSHLDDGYRPGL